MSQPIGEAGTDGPLDFAVPDGARTQPNSQTSTVPDHPEQSEWDQLQGQLTLKPYDPTGWSRLVEIAEESGDTEKIKAAYDLLLEAYPNTSAAQIAYLDHFLRPGLFPVAEELFMRFLRTSHSVDLYRHYLNYVRRMNSGPSAREIVRKSYDFALNQIGQDKDSSGLWAEYISFLKDAEPASTWEEQQKMDALRKVYHRAVQIPLENVEQIWSDLESFENSLNKITAKKFMSDLTPSYMQARQVLRQLQKYLGPLAPPPPPSNSPGPHFNLPPLPTFNAQERALAGAWKTYLKWEESNPLELEEKDKATLISRVQGVYKKALVRMRFFGEIWYMAYVWTNSVGKTDEAMSILKSGIKANPTSFVLNFAYAEVLELKEKFDEVHTVFNKFLEALRHDLEEVEARVSSANTSFASTGSQGATVNLNGSGYEGAGSSVVNNMTASNLDITINSQNMSFASQTSDERSSKHKEVAERRTEYGLVWIMYMRFSRRAEGLKAWRSVFKEARKDRWTPWEVYEAAALMEYHCTKDAQIASRIFDMGLKTFSDEVDFALRYLGFLISINDDMNARALFERVVKTFPPERARPLWERWARYEYQYGDLAAAQLMEKRIAEVYPNDPSIKRFAQRHNYLSTDAIASRDLGFGIVRQSVGSSGSSNGSIGRTETQNSFASIANPSANVTSSSDRKRPPSPPEKRRDDKRHRGISPPRDRERDRRDPPPSRRRFNSPSRERDREWDGSRGRADREDEKPGDKPVTVPPILTWFIGTLPTAASFDGPVFRTNDLMQLFREAVIPSSTAGPRKESPAPARGPGVGRPPPDYGPYQGPTSNPNTRGRRW